MLTIHETAGPILSTEQLDALARFAGDLQDVLTRAAVSPLESKRIVRDLTRAYHLALISRRWEPLIMHLDEFLCRLSDYAEVNRLFRAPPYTRLRSIVLENADLIKRGSQ